VLNCSSDFPRRCTYDRELIVSADQVSQMEEFKYKLGPIANTLNTGCIVLTKQAHVYYIGKTCRKVIGK
jgi:hypothetical protein